MDRTSTNQGWPEPRQIKGGQKLDNILVRNLHFHLGCLSPFLVREFYQDNGFVYCKVDKNMIFLVRLDISFSVKLAELSGFARGKKYSHF